MTAQDECPPLPREKAGQQVSRYHVTAVDYRRKGTKSPASRELGAWNMKSFRLYVTKWERRDVVAWLLRSTIFSAIMLALLFVAGDLQGQPIHWCLLVVFAFVLDARFTDRNVQYRLSLANPDEVCPSSEEYHVSPAPEDDKP